MADVASDPEMRLNRQLAGGFAVEASPEPPGEADAGTTRPEQENPSRRAAAGAIIVFWILQFIYFSLDKFFRGEDVLWSTIAVRAVVSGIGAFISFQILGILQRSAGTSFLKRAIVALALACAASAIHSVMNWALFLAVNGPSDGGKFSLAVEIATYPPLFYLFSWVYLAISVILLSITYGGEIVLRERRIAELTRQAEDAPQDDPHVWVRSGSGQVRIDIADIRWISAEGECVRFHCGDRTFLERLSISAATERLGPFGFVRIHRSTLVNPRHVEGLGRTSWGALQLRLSSGAQLRVSKSFQREVRTLVAGGRLVGGMDSTADDRDPPTRS
jgi:DNA-binding LytR/AlgR family response regulator